MPNRDHTVTPDELKRLAENAQSDIHKIQEINSIIQQEINENDIIGTVYESIVSNLRTDISLTFDRLSGSHEAETKEKAESLIRRFHQETDIDRLLSSSISAVYTEGTCIKYLRRVNGRCIIDMFPLGVGLVSSYQTDGCHYVLIDIGELTNRLQESGTGAQGNKFLFFDTIEEEIRANYPDEVYQAYLNKEPYAKLDLRKTGLNRYCDMNHEYGLSPVFKAVKPALILDTFEETDRNNARAKKIIHQVLRKEVMGPAFEKKGLEEMAYAHKNLVSAWENPAILYTSPPCVEKIKYVEPEIRPTAKDTIHLYRSRIISALGISVLNTDISPEKAAAVISLNQLMKILIKIAGQEETILSRWYSILLEENDIPQEYCPTPHILDAGLLEAEMKKDLAGLPFNRAG